MKTKKIFNYRLILLVLVLLFFNGIIFGDDGLADSFSTDRLIVSTINAWSGLGQDGLIKRKEYESAKDRDFRHEVLLSGLRDLNSDVIIINGINPAMGFAKTAAEALGMTAEAAVSRAGFRIGPVSLPLNLKEGDAILTRGGEASDRKFGSEDAGNLHLNGLISAGGFSFLSAEGVQVKGIKLIPPREEAAKGSYEGPGIYIFSVVWTESVINDYETLERLLKAYKSGKITADEYTAAVEDAVDGSEKRLEQAKETLSFINSEAGASPVIIAGSLNALPESKEVEILKSAGFKDVFERTGRGKGYTFNKMKNSNFSKIRDTDGPSADYIYSNSRLDYIMIRGNGLWAKSAEIVLDDSVYGVYPSLRYGIRAVIGLR